MNRRRFLQFAFGASLGLSARRAFGGGPKKPNVVLIFADDLGWKDMGCMGSDFYETPNLARLQAVVVGRTGVAEMRRI